MIEKHILNLMYEKVNIKDLFPLVEVAAKTNNINLMYDSGSGTFLDKLLEYYIRDDVSSQIDFLVENTKGEILGSLDSRKSTVKHMLKFYSKTSNYDYTAYTTEVDNNLHSLLKNYRGQIIQILDTFDENISSSFFDKIVSLKSYNLADLLLKEDPNCLNKSIVKVENQAKMIEKIINAGGDLNQYVYHHGISGEKKPVYSLLRSSNAKNQEIVAMVEEWANKNLDEKEVFKINNAMYFQRLKGSGNNAESVLKSEKDWAARYNENGVSAARLAIKEHLNGYGKSVTFIHKMLDTQKAIAALKTLDDKGENLWFEDNVLNKLDKTGFIIAGVVVPFVANNEGQAIFNKLSPAKIAQNTFVKEQKYNAQLINIFYSQEVPVSGWFGDWKNQELLADKFIEENMLTSTNASFFAQILQKSIDRNILNDIHPKLKGIFLLSECIAGLSEENEKFFDIIIQSDIEINIEYALNHDKVEDKDFLRNVISKIEAKELKNTFKDLKTESKIKQRI